MPQGDSGNAGMLEALQWREYVPESALGRQHRLWLLALMTLFLVCGGRQYSDVERCAYDKSRWLGHRF